MKHSALLTGCACALALLGPASAQVLLLDFGPTTAIDDAGAGNSLTNSPYHVVNGSFANTGWNTRGIADAAAGTLVWSTGATAAGVSLNIGATTDTGTLLGLNNAPGNSGALGATINSGVYANTSVAKDAIYTGTSGNTRAVGAQIGGLSAGTYDIYLTGRNTNISTAHVQNFYVGKSAAATNFNFSGYTTGSLSFGNTTTSATSAWVQGANYVKLSIVLSSGDYLNLAVQGGTGETRGFLGMVEIVGTSAIPEPAAVAFFTGLACLLGTAGIALRRRRRNPAA